MHFRGHVDPWCRKNCDPDKLEEIKKVSKRGFNFNIYVRIQKRGLLINLFADSIHRSILRSVNNPLRGCLVMQR